MKTSSSKCYGLAYFQKQHINVENIPLQIGRLSAGEAYTINLCTLPNLFVSYSDEEHLPTIFKSFIQQLHNYDSTILLSLSFSSSLSKQLKTFTASSNIYVEFNHGAEETSAIKNIDEFIKIIFGEMKNRTTIIKKKRLVILPSMVVLIDDIFEVLRARNRKTTNAFIHLLKKGALVKIYFILGSAGIYKNLLQQLINEIPSKLTNSKTKNATKNFYILGAEMVMSFDGLIFLKEKGSNIYTKFYPLN